MSNENRPGDVIRFEGNQTQDGIINNYDVENNHSMDYYSKIADSVDAASWQIILAETGDQDVFLAGDRKVVDVISHDGQPAHSEEIFSVDTGADTLTDPLGSDYDIYYGGRGNDVLTGGSDNELLLGGIGNDVLKGGGGADRLFGGSNNDILTGGKGRDKMVGGLGSDTFVFTSESDSAVGKLHDVISGFLSGKDKIDLSKIDANPFVPFNNSFNFIYSDTFSQVGQLRFANGILAGNTDLDLQAEFQIELTGVTNLAANDIIHIYQTT